MALTTAEAEAIENVLARSRSLGFLGPGSVRAQVEHALGFTAGPVGLPIVDGAARTSADDAATHVGSDAVGGTRTGRAGMDDAPIVRRSARRVLDLGSGGGVPGLVLALAWPDAELVLLDASARRVAFLGEAVAELGLADRVRAVQARAEAAGRDPALRGRFDVVVARGFGPPAATAECGAPLLVEGGWLLVSDPPLEDDGGAAERWPAEGLALLGLAVERTWREPFHYSALRLRTACPERFPRRDGVPSNRPLF